MMIGNPGESNVTIKKSIELLNRIHPDRISTSITMVFPDTELYEIAQNCGLLSEEYWLSDCPPPYFTCEHPLSRLFTWRDDYYRKTGFDGCDLGEKLTFEMRSLRNAIWLKSGYYFSKKGFVRSKPCTPFPLTNA